LRLESTIISVSETMYEIAGTLILEGESYAVTGIEEAHENLKYSIFSPK
jgi:hypothetical protein